MELYDYIKLIKKLATPLGNILSLRNVGCIGISYLYTNVTSQAWVCILLAFFSLLIRLIKWATSLFIIYIAIWISNTSLFINVNDANPISHHFLSKYTKIEKEIQTLTDKV